MQWYHIATNWSTNCRLEAAKSSPSEKMLEFGQVDVFSHKYLFIFLVSHKQFEVLTKNLDESYLARKTILMFTTRDVKNSFVFHFIDDK